MPSLICVSLEGLPPEELDLDSLGSRDRTFAIASTTFVGDDTNAAHIVRDIATPIASSDAPRIIYCFGHAWLQDGRFATSVVREGQSVVLDGHELIQQLSRWAAGPTLLIVDTCHAAALGVELDALRPARWSVIFGAAQDESALEITGEGSRLAFALSAAMRQARKGGWADAATLVVYANSYLRRDPLLAGQRIGLWANGSPFADLVETESAATRERAGRRLRFQLVAAGAAVVLLVIAGVEFYRSTVWIEIDVALARPAFGRGAIRIVQHRPQEDKVEIVQTRIIEGNVVRFRAPAADLTVEYDGEFADGGERKLYFPILAKPGLSWSDKWITVQFPKAAEIVRHPGMALVKGRPWLRGAEREPVSALPSFWIDIRPPTVAEYLPLATRENAAGELEPHESVLLHAQALASATGAVGASQLTTLVPQLNQISDVVMAERRADVVSPSGDAASITRPALPCAACPAPMSYKEARLFCAARNLRLPSPDEWEYAARGVDGRLYPFGDKFDAKRINAPGLPAKGAVAPDLVPVLAFPDAVTPFGLIDMVGNAGDWVDAGDENQRRFMGGTYRQNIEDVTTYASMPSPEEPLPYLPVTARCVSYAAVR